MNMAVGFGKNTAVDEGFLRRALDQAQINVLRVALYQQTRDPDLAAILAVPSRVAGTPYEFPKIAHAYHGMIRDKAFAFLRNRPLGAPSVVPTRAEAHDLMEMFSGAPVSPAVNEFGWGELAFDDLMRAAHWKKRLPANALGGYHVTIIGAGFSGLMAAIQMQRLGLKFTIIERQAGIGGTWFLNHYPEARVDIPSFAYQYKFEQDYPWKSHFATQAELQDYVNYIVDKHKLRDHIRLSSKIVDASWDDARKQWSVEVSGPDGKHDTLHSNFLISASGLFSTPKPPRIPGVETFGGKMFHTTAWDHSYDFSGKRVAVIGTGSTGSQLARAIAAKADHLAIYQRTPHWVNPVRGYRHPVSAELRWLLDNMPGYRNWFTYHQFASALQTQSFQYIDPEWRKSGGLINEKNDQMREMLQTFIRSKVGDNDDLYERLVPKYAPMSRRLVIDNDWYDTLMLPNVELVSGPVDRFTKTGIVSADGKNRDFDLVVLSTGFDVERYLWPVEYHGRDGVQLQDLWGADGARAHLTMTIPGFPNFMILYGPNAGTVVGSFHSWIEILSRYCCQLITHCIESGAGSFEVKDPVYRDYNAKMDEALKRLLLEDQGGGGGYYLNSHGRPGVTMPWTFDEWCELVREPDFAEYDFR